MFRETLGPAAVICSAALTSRRMPEPLDRTSSPEPNSGVYASRHRLLGMTEKTGSPESSTDHNGLQDTPLSGCSFLSGCLHVCLRRMGT